MAKRPLPDPLQCHSFKRRRIELPNTLSDILGGSSAETQRTLPSASCISNVLSQQSQENLHKQLSKILDSPPPQESNAEHVSDLCYFFTGS